MTWPVLPDDTLVARKAGELVVVHLPSGAVVHANEQAAFVLEHRQLFSDVDDAARVLADVFDVAEPTMHASLDVLQRRLQLPTPVKRPRAQYLDSARRDRAEAVVPRMVDAEFSVDALGVCVQVVSHDTVLSTALAPLLEAHGGCHAPDERLDVWRDRFGTSIALNGRRMGSDSTLSLALQTVVGMLTAIAVDAGAGRSLLVHAAAVAIDGSGVVLVGGSGAGKTSTTVELVRDGASYLTDELVRVDAPRRRVVGFPRALGLEGPVRLQHPDLRPVWWTDSDVDRRWTLAPRQVGRVAQDATMGMLVFLDQDTSAPPATTALDWPEALARLMPALYNRESLTHDGLDDVIGLLDHVPCYGVRHRGSRSAADQVTALLRDGARGG